MKFTALARLLEVGFVTALALSTAVAYAADEKKPPAATQAPAATTQAPIKAATPAPMKAAERMDINSASEEQLATLDGIGKARASAIVKGRPYTGKDDLVKKKVLSEGVYDKIKDQIIARQK
jgi:competence protein ComEA